MTPKPEIAYDVVNVEVGIASQGGISGTALRFHLPDGTATTYVLRDHLARALAKAIQDQQRAAEAPASPRTN